MKRVAITGKFTIQEGARKEASISSGIAGISSRYREQNRDV